MASIAPKNALHPTVEQIKSLYNGLIDENLTPASREKIFTQLGVDSRDGDAQSRLLRVIQDIANGQLTPEYSAENQMVFFRNCQSGSIEAVFKPGLMRAQDESSFRRIANLTGTPDSAPPTMIATFDFSELFPVAAQEINPEAFNDVLISDSTSVSSVESEEDSDDDVFFESDGESTPGEISQTTGEIPITEFSFAQETTRSGRRFCFLPKVEGSDCGAVGIDGRDLQLTGTLPGVLQPWIVSCNSPNQPGENRFAKTILLASALGMRDLKPDALVGETIIDAEEFMAAATSNPKPNCPQPSLHLPVLKDPKAVRYLELDELRNIREWVLGLNVSELVQYVRSQEMPFRMIDLEELEDDGDEDTQVLKSGDFRFTVEIENGREEQFFPRISTKERGLFAQEQVDAFAARLKRLQQTVIDWGEDVSQWPKTSLFHLACQIDPEYGRYVDTVFKARFEELQSANSSNLAPETRRRLCLDSSPAVFLAALTEHAGRYPLVLKPKVKQAVSTHTHPPINATGMRERTSSMPEMLLYKRKQKNGAAPANESPQPESPLRAKSTYISSLPQFSQ